MKESNRTIQLRICHDRAFLGLFLSSSRLEFGFRMKNESNIFSFFAEDDANMYVYDISLLHIEYMPCIFQIQGKILAISSEQIVRLLFFLSRIQIVHQIPWIRILAVA